MKKQIAAAILLAAVTLVTGCHNGDAEQSSGAAATDPEISGVYTEPEKENSDLSERTQTTDDWKFKYNKKLGGIIIEKCLCAKTRDGDRVYNAVDDVVVPSEFEGFEGVKVLEIGSYAFKNMEVNSITLPDTLIYIDKEAFSDTVIHDTFTIPESVTDLSEGALKDCACDEIILPPVEVLPKEVLYSSGIKSITIPDTVTKIDESAFGYCYSLTDVVCGKGLKEIGSLAFYHCLSLENVTFNEGLEILGYACFSHDSKLTEKTVYLPDTLKSIDELGPFTTAIGSEDTKIFEYRDNAYTYGEILSLLSSSNNSGNEE